MDTYDSKMAARFRAALTERAVHLGRVLGHETEFAAEAGLHEVGDFKDVAVQEAIAGVDEAQATQAATELEQIRAALRRIEDGTYGECTDCGDPIDLRRLVAMPTAAYCAPCQAVHERALVRY
jgi:RNA polymerase-binding transcription factor DksA